MVLLWLFSIIVSLSLLLRFLLVHDRLAALSRIACWEGVVLMTFHMYLVILDIRDVYTLYIMTSWAGGEIR